MRWAGAIAALFLCLVVCLLVVAIRIETLELRRTTHAVQRETMHVAAERDRLVQQITYMRRRGELQARYRLHTGGGAGGGPSVRLRSGGGTDPGR